MIGFSFIRGSTWRSTVYAPRSCCSMEVYLVSVPFRTGTKILGTLSPPVISAITPNPYLLESQTSNSNGSHSWEMAQSFNLFKSLILLSSQRQLGALTPSLIGALSLPCCLKNRSTVPGVPKHKNPYKILHLFQVLRNRIDSYLTNHNLWDNKGLIPQYI